MCVKVRSKGKYKKKTKVMLIKNTKSQLLKKMDETLEKVQVYFKVMLIKNTKSQLIKMMDKTPERDTRVY